MSKASIRRHARLKRVDHRARRRLYRRPHGRRLVAAIRSCGSAANAGFSMTGVHIKAFDVSRVVDDTLPHYVSGYSPSADSGKAMCSALDVCGGRMNNVLIETAAKLRKLRWDFTYDDQFIAVAQGKSLTDFKVQVSGNTK